jgi:hypothetical protein
MVLLRLLLIAFNVGVVTYLIYHLFEVSRQSISKTRKTVVIVGGIMLLIAPLGMFFRIFFPTMQYFIIYPVAIAMYVYLTRQL